MSKVTITTIDNAYPGATNINANFLRLQEAIEGLLSRDGTAPNEMDANLDMNSKRLINLPPGITRGEPVTVGQYLGDAAVTVPELGEWTGWFNVNDYASAGDDDDAVDAAILAMTNTSPYFGTLYFPRGSYRLTREHVLIHSRQKIVGDDAYIEFAPSVDSNLFNFHNSEGLTNPPGSGVDNFCEVKGIHLWTQDSTHNKVFLRFGDSCETTIRNVTITGSGGYAIGKNTTGIQLNGHESVWMDNVSIYASIPLHINTISNTYQSYPGWLSADHFHFNNCLFAAGDLTKAPLSNGGTFQHACVYASDLTHFSETKFSGSQAWVGGKYGFYCNWVTNNNVASTNLTFENVRTEQLYDPAGYSIYMSCGPSAQPLYNLTMNRCNFTNACHAVYEKGVYNVTFNDCVMLQGANQYLIYQEGLTNYLSFNSCKFASDTRSTKMYLPTFDNGGGNNGKLRLSYASPEELNSTQIYPPTMHFVRKAINRENRGPDFMIGNLCKWQWHGLVRGTTDIYLPLTSDVNWVNTGTVTIFCNDGYDTHAYGTYHLSRSPGMTAAVNGTSPYKGIALQGLGTTGVLNATIGTAVAANQITLYTGGASGLLNSVRFQHNLNVANVTGTNINASENVASSGYPGFTAASGTPFVNLRAGMWIETTGFSNAGNNGKFLILTQSNTELQVSREGVSGGETIVNETNGASIIMYNVCSVTMNATYWRSERSATSNEPLITDGVSD